VPPAAATSVGSTSASVAGVRTAVPGATGDRPAAGRTIIGTPAAASWKNTLFPVP
jgi:hypothetical protein